jgi:predicted nucleotidyltransferase
MRDQTKQALIQAIKAHPAILSAALTGSQARPAAADQFSDLDVLLVARDVKAVSDVRSWLRGAEHILICANHLSNYCTVLLDDFQKIDLGIFPADEPSSRWVIQDYEIIKGGEDFEARLAAAATLTREKKAAHLNPDVCMDNVLLLLVTAQHRVSRGEELSAHAWVAMASDMLVALETRQQGPDGEADLLDLRRRLERRRPTLAAVLQECLFGPPASGLRTLARYLETAHNAALTDKQRQVLSWLLEPGQHSSG